MSTALRKPLMTREQFFAWAAADGGRWEFDGRTPIRMADATISRSGISVSICMVLRRPPRHTKWRAYGSTVGIATVGNTARYPDATVTCTKAAGTAHLVPDPVIVFEVMTPGSERTDRIIKLREYRAVPSIRRYVILEYASAELTLLSRPDGVSDWTATALTAADTLPLPELGIEIPIAELYEDIDLPDLPPDEAAA